MTLFYVTTPNDAHPPMYIKAETVEAAKTVFRSDLRDDEHTDAEFFPVLDLETLVDSLPDVFYIELDFPC